MYGNDHGLMFILFRAPTRVQVLQFCCFIFTSAALRLGGVIMAASISSTLGKRDRDAEESVEERSSENARDKHSEQTAVSKDNGDGDSSDGEDDDVGPMPLPEKGAENGGVARKRRKGVSLGLRRIVTY